MHDRTLELVAELRRLKPDSPVLRFFEPDLADTQSRRALPRACAAADARCIASAGHPATLTRVVKVAAGNGAGRASLAVAARRLGRAIVARALR